MKLVMLSAALATAVLAGCGGGGSSEPEVPPQADNQVQASALVSAEAYTRYAASLAPSETAEPVDVSGVTPPTSETSEPLPL